MTTKDEGGQVYPVVSPVVEQVHAAGITRRDWLAGLAMQGLLASHAPYTDPYSMLAEEAYDIADAMIAEGKR